MATMITSECINCGACEPECPNTAIYQGGVEWELDGAKHPAIANEIFYIVPEKCTECVGFFDHEACAAVCPVDCCVPNPEIPETHDVLLARAGQLHPEQSFGPDSPSRFKKDGAATEAPAAATTAPAAQPSPAPAPAAQAVAAVAPAASPEDALAAAVPALEDYEVPLRCFRCSGEFAVAFQYLRPGTVLHCPHCVGSFVPNTALYQGIAGKLEKFYRAWTKSFAEFRDRRARELERFEASQRAALEALERDIKLVSERSEVAGAPQRSRGMFG